MNSKITKKYIPYFFSYLLVYPCSFPLLLMLTFATESPQIPEKTTDMVWYIFSSFVTIIGSVVLNFIFKRALKLEKNNKETWIIFFVHIILIPITYLIGIEILFLFD